MKIHVFGAAVGKTAVITTGRGKHKADESDENEVSPTL